MRIATAVLALGFAVLSSLSAGCPSPTNAPDEVCGDGVRNADEACDDADLGGASCASLGFAGGDLRCTSSCAVDTSACVESICGNSTLDPGEGCDDGNDVDGDGCDTNCLGTGCGNGVQTDGEECDDDNRVDGDGCSSTCTLEPAEGEGEGEGEGAGEGEGEGEGDCVSDCDGDGVAAPADCDDDDAAVRPGAAEIPWNGVDDDCDDATGPDLIVTNQLLGTVRAIASASDGARVAIKRGAGAIDVYEGGATLTLLGTLNDRLRAPVAVAVDGDVMYVARDDATLAVFDIASAPFRERQSVPAVGAALLLSGDRLYAFDVAFDSPGGIARFDRDSTGEIVGMVAQTSDPGFPLGATADFLWTLGGDGFDARSATTLALLSHIDVSTPLLATALTDGPQGAYAYVGRGATEGLLIISYVDPSEPVQTSMPPLAFDVPSDPQAALSLAFTNGRLLASDGTSTAVLSLEDPTAPQIVSQAAGSLGGTRSVPTPTGFFAVGGDDVLAIRVDALDAVVVTPTGARRGHQVSAATVLDDGVTFALHTDHRFDPSGVDLLLASPSTFPAGGIGGPVSVHTPPTDVDESPLAVLDDVVFQGSGHSLISWRVVGDALVRSELDLGASTAEDEFSSIEIIGDTLIVTIDTFPSTGAIVDVSVPSTPILVGTFGPIASPAFVHVAGQLFVSDPFGPAFEAWDMTDPRAPSGPTPVAPSLTPPEFVSGQPFAAEGNTLCVIDDGNDGATLRCADVSDPSAPASIRTLPLPRNNTAVALRSGHAFVLQVPRTFQPTVLNGPAVTVVELDLANPLSISATLPGGLDFLGDSITARGRWLLAPVGEGVMPLRLDGL